MKKAIDCLFIGINEMDFSEYERRLRILGTKHAAYRELDTGFLRYEGQPRTAGEIYNLLCFDKESQSSRFSFGDILSPTIAYLGTFLARRGFTFDYINWFQDEKEELKKKLLEDDILTIAIPTTMYTVVTPILDLIEFIKKYNDRAKIVLGGQFIYKSIVWPDNPNPQKSFEELVGADYYVVSSQGESALVQLLHALKNDLPVADIPNLIYKDKQGYHATPVVTENNPLEENMVDWSLFGDRVGKIVGVRTAISCPFSCAFCQFPSFAGKYQTVSVEAIERELDSIERTGKVETVQFIDDTFNIPTERFKAILRMMIRKKYSFRWTSFFRCQYADREMIQLMKESGCEGVIQGIESGNQQVLDNINKKVTIDQYRRGHALLNEYDITTIDSFMVGFPGETDESIQDTYRFIHEINPTFFGVFVWFCSPSAPIWSQREKYQIKGMQNNWSHATMDSQKACDYHDFLLLNVKNSVWIPKHSFQHHGIITLLHSGLSLEQVKNYLNAFNNGVKEKVLDPAKKDASPEIVAQIRNSCR